LVVMLSLSNSLYPVSVPDVSFSSDFGGLGKAGLATVIFISVLLLVVFIWLINGTRKHD